MHVQLTVSVCCFTDHHVLFQTYLSECQLYLEAVPAMFRLELLENIFSLLFLSTTDFVQQVRKDINLGDLPQVGAIADRVEQDTMELQQQQTSPRAQHAHLDLGLLLQGCTGFLADVTAMQGFLRLLKEGLEGMCVVGQEEEGQEAGRALPREAEAAESLGCSVTAETFGPRLQSLSKRTAEAQWRLQIISSNQAGGSGENPYQPNYIDGVVQIMLMGFLQTITHKKKDNISACIDVLLYSRILENGQSNLMLIQKIHKKLLFLECFFFFNHRLLFYLVAILASNPPL